MPHKEYLGKIIPDRLLNKGKKKPILYFIHGLALISLQTTEPSQKRSHICSYLVPGLSERKSEIDYVMKSNEKL